MKLLKKIILILVVFFKTGTLLSDNNLFNVNNILIEKKANIENSEQANQAIKKGFDQLIKKILLKKDFSKISDLNFSDIKQLVTYYNISKNVENENDEIKYSITFDKDKLHKLFYQKKILYSDIQEKEFFILPILIKSDEIFIFSNNYFYKSWNKLDNSDLIEFILPLENIEIIQNINVSKDSLLDLNLNSLFKEYPGKNKALVLIETNNFNEKKIYFKALIQGKSFTKNIILNRRDLEQAKFNDQVVFTIKDEITNLVKEQNLIDIRTPSFLNVKLDLNKKNSLVLLNSKIKNIDLIENMFVREFNKDYVELKIKYLGKLENIINLLKKEDINLKFTNNEWIIKTL